MHSLRAQGLLSYLLMRIFFVPPSQKVPGITWPGSTGMCDEEFAGISNVHSIFTGFVSCTLNT